MDKGSIKGFQQASLTSCPPSQLMLAHHLDHTATAKLNKKSRLYLQPCQGKEREGSKVYNRLSYVSVKVLSQPGHLEVKGLT